MFTAQLGLNIVLTVVIAYLVTLNWNLQTKVSDLPRGQGQTNQVNDKNPVAMTFEEKQGHVISSVWCHHGNNRFCQFENLCYKSDQDEFVMFQDDDSVIENVQFTSGSLTLDLTSVREHNLMQTTITSLPSMYSKDFRKSWIITKSLIFKRFLPSNLMHMFHDDILPLHDSLKYLSHGTNKNKTDSFDIQLLVFNDTEEEPGEEVDMFYEVFSSFIVKFKRDLKYLNTGSDMVCFTDVTLGLSTRTTWYDYGFKSPQGPLNVIHLNEEHIHSTTKLILQNIITISDRVIQEDYVVLLSRKENRRILNEMELTIEIVKKSRLKVVNLSLDTHSLSEIIFYIRNCKGIIGMHGSLFILSLFLRPLTYVIEMFPYAVNPDHYTPYRTLSQIMGASLEYRSWTNQRKENSVGHPDWSPEMGGINHLEDNLREKILLETEVPQHLCCSDPSWLYHIYQDTIVNVTEITYLISSCRETFDNIKNTNSDFKESQQSQSRKNLYPSKVKGVNCHKHCLDSNSYPNSYDKCYVVVEFSQPWSINLSQAGRQDVSYEILLQNVSSDQQNVINHITHKNTITISVDPDCSYVVWVRCVLNLVNTGPFSDSVFCVE